MLLGDSRDFTALVVFDPGAKPTARYDLFDVDTDGTLNDMKEHTTPDADPDISFSIEGTVAAMTAAAPRMAAIETVALPRTAPAAIRKQARKRSPK
jgi:hypothetical protein